MSTGRSLAEVIAADGPLAPRDAARVGAQVLAALVRGHREGLVHGAVEPARVQLEGGRAVLAEFADGPYDGDPEYLAPERTAGRAPGPETDLWSLGATLFTAVEGRPPFPGRRPGPAERPPEPRRAGTLAPVIASLLRPDPGQRPGAEWTGHMLDRVAAGLTVGPATAEALPARETVAVAAPAGPPTGPPAPRAAGARRRPGVWVAALVLALAVLGGVVFLLVGRGGTHHQAGTASPSVPPSATGPPSGVQPPSTEPSAPQTTPATPTTTPTTPSPTTPPPATESPSPAAPSTPAPSTPAQTPGAEVPPGYVRTTDPAGFSFAAPIGWTRTDNGMGAGDYSPDNRGHILRFTVVPNPAGQAPLDGFLQIERSLTQQGGYSRIDLRTNTYQGNPGASWEFTFGSAHLGAQSFLAPNGTEYTVYLSTPESDWAAYQPVLATALNTFTIP
ncbi:protein kinase domain-containing protein [Streptomyces sp. 1331.2]|uniref:protein kinase domain-containing protein n=1 Tax=Streptomyces sp. 1331.2 TaxID=1938835 RepID=UPI000BC9125E|nr:Protein kinase domain-containing protein [Streptomyces sp. 1331.2]